MELLQPERLVAAGRKIGRIFWRDRVNALGWIEQVIQHQPQTSGVVEKKNRKDHRKRYPDGELLVYPDIRDSVEDEKSRHCNQHGRGIIHVDGADEIALLSFELQTAMCAIVTHPERLCV